MIPTIELFIGAPLKGSEAAFLSRLYSDLAAHGQCLILANFEVGRKSASTQIDFVVVTSRRAELLELKCLTGPVFGTENGPWTMKDPSGSLVSYPGKNPWQQAKDAKLVLNDAMHEYRKRSSDVPNPLKSRFFEFDARVCIYPKLHPHSNVTQGNFKAWVGSYEETLTALTTRPLPSGWSVNVWRRFAMEHLRLTPVTLAEATDPAFSLSLHRTREYLARLKTAFAKDLGPLLAHEEGEACGENALEQLLGESNYVLLGSSGLGKSFHLRHLAMRVPKQEEVPILVEARHLTGDFTEALRRAIGPFTGSELRVFLDGIRNCGLRPLLIVDGINGRESFVADLLKDILAFQVQHEARVIIGSQKEFELPGGLAVNRVTLAPLRPEHKRAIYCFHAGTTDRPDLAPFCEAFGTAFDLMIAGRIHGGAPKPLTRAKLYERYCRKTLPPQYPAVAASILRDLARRMSAEFVSSISLQEFERCAEALLRECREPLHILDDLRTCPMLRIGDDTVSFQHDLLKDYFLADELWRKHRDSAELSEELSKPANQRLLEFILPKYSSLSDIRQVLRSVSDSSILLEIMRGKAGQRSQQVLRQVCDDLIDDAIHAHRELELTFQIIEDSDGKRRVGLPLLTGTRHWSAHEAQLCDLWAQSLDDEHFCDRFFTLLDLTEQALKAATDKAARELGISNRASWGEVIREYAGGLIRGDLQLPLERIMSGVRAKYVFRRDRELGRKLYNGLVDRATRTPASDFSMALILELMRWNEPNDVDLRVKLLEIAAKNRIFILWVQAVEMIRCCTSYVTEKRPDVRDKIVEILEGMLKSVSIDSIGIMEVLSGFGAIDPPVDFESAVNEFQRAARGELSEHDLSLMTSLEPTSSPDQFCADTAYGLIGRIFEDIFQGVYWEAFNSLDEDEKVRCLCRAAMARDPGFYITWILEQLIPKGNPVAAPVYQRFASFLDRDSPFRQEAVGALVLGTAGWATVSAEPCRLEGPGDGNLRVWGLVAQMLFWLFRLGPKHSKGRIKSLWECLNNEVPLAAADALYELSQSGAPFGPRNDVGEKLMRLFPGETRKMLEASLSHRDRLTSFFRTWQGRDVELLRFVIDRLGEFGVETSVESLRSLAEDPRVGAAAIAAIKGIRNRTRGLEKMS